MDISLGIYFPVHISIAFITVSFCTFTQTEIFLATLSNCTTQRITNWLARNSFPFIRNSCSVNFALLWRHSKLATLPANNFPLKKLGNLIQKTAAFLQTYSRLGETVFSVTRIVCNWLIVIRRFIGPPGRCGCGNPRPAKMDACSSEISLPIALTCQNILG